MRGLRDHDEREAAEEARVLRLRLVRAELDHLVSTRWSAGLSRVEQARYDELVDEELELLRASSSKASATSS